MSKKTNWRSVLDSNYLGGHDLDNGKGGHDRVTVTIKEAKREEVTGEGGRKEYLIVIRFKEKIKPFISNKTNNKVIEKLAGSRYMEDWAGTRIEIYFDPSVKFGREVVGGLRVMKVPPQPNAATPTPIVPCTDCGETVKAGGGATVQQIIDGTEKTYGNVLCLECAGKRKGATNAD